MQIFCFIAFLTHSFFSAPRLLNFPFFSEKVKKKKKNHISKVSKNLKKPKKQCAEKPILKAMHAIF